MGDRRAGVGTVWREELTVELQELEERAAVHGRQGSYGPAAVSLNERILKLDPGNLTALLRLVRCHTECEDWQAAHDSYRRLLELGVGDPARIQEKLKETQDRAAEQVEAERQGEECARKKRERDARLKREQHEREQQRHQQLVAEARAMTSLGNVRGLAIAAREARDYAVSLVYHERSLELAASKGDRTGALAAYASTLRQVNRPADALAALRESIELEPARDRNKHSYTSLVATLRELEHLDEARTEGESLLALHPDDSWVLFALGRVFKDLFARDRKGHLLDQANLYYRRAAELKPGDRNILAELRSLVTLYDKLAEQLGAPEIAEQGRQLELHIARLERLEPPAS